MFVLPVGIFGTVTPGAGADPPVFQEAGIGDTRSNPANALTPSYPILGLAANDTFWCLITIHADAGHAANESGGWTLIASKVSGDLGTWLFKKVATGTETGTAAFDWNGTNVTGSMIAGATIYRYRGASTGHGGVVTATGTGATANMPTVDTGVEVARALTFLSWNDNCKLETSPTGESGGDWLFRSRDRTTGGDDAGWGLYEANMAGGGTISGGTLTQDELPTRWNAISLYISGAGVPGDSEGTFYISTTGNDTTGDGTSGNPWRTFAKGKSVVGPGETLIARGGTYREAPFTWDTSGNAGSRITVKGFPGEVPILDANLATFQTAGGWTLHDAGTETYRSGTGHSASATWTGSFEVGGRLYRLPQYNQLTWLMATTYTWRSDGVYYRGPGFCVHTDGRIYIRLQNLSSPRNAGIPSDYESSHPLGDAKAIPPTGGGFDPNTFVIHLSTVADMFNISGSHLDFKGIRFLGGDRGPRFTGVSNVTLEHCDLWGQRINWRLEANNSNISVLHCDTENGVPPWISWNEVKTNDVNNPGLKMSFVTCDPNNDNILVEDNLIRSAFDGMATIRGDSNNNRFLNNTVRWMFDDFIQFDGGSTNLEVGWNFISGGGPGYNGGGSSTAATKWFHHNVIDVRRGEFGWRIGAEANNGGGTAWRLSHAAFPIHSVDSNTPAKVYNNTILYKNNINNDGCRIERQGLKTGGLHEAYNNIAYGVGAHSYTRGVTIGSTDQILDYNLAHETTGYTSGKFREWAGANYADLAAWKASAGFTSSQAVYSPGFENNSKEGDPTFGNLTTSWPTTPGLCDYRPSAVGIAATGAKNLTSTGWPGGDNGGYFGAVDPAASTGLGAVGHRGTPGTGGNSS